MAFLEPDHFSRSLFGMVVSPFLPGGFRLPSSKPFAPPARKPFRAEPHRPTMLITQGAYTAIMRDLASRTFQREQGGILLGPKDTPDLVTHYVKDEWGTGRTTSFTISPDHLNRIIDSVRPANMTCVGMVHSHPPGICQASHGDMQFLHRIFSNPKNGGGRFLFPIVCNGKLHPYVVDTSDVSRIVTADLLLV